MTDVFFDLLLAGVALAMVVLAVEVNSLSKKLSAPSKPSFTPLSTQPSIQQAVNEKPKKFWEAYLDVLEGSKQTGEEGKPVPVPEPKTEAPKESEVPKEAEKPGARVFSMEDFVNAA
jgi:hypothetical protein